MTAIGMSTGHAARTQRPSLSDVLGAHGIQTMPRFWADEHKASFLYRIRSSGYGPWATPMLLAIRWLLLALSLVFIPLAIERERHEKLASVAGMALGGIVVSLFFTGVVTGLFVHPAFGLMAVPAIALVVSYFFETGRRLADMVQLAYSTSWWVSLRLMPGERPWSVSPALRERIQHAMNLPGVRVYEEVLDDDPLVYAARGWGPFKEICYLGGYDTGNRRIDTF